jgi:hypothetical protein
MAALLIRLGAGQRIDAVVLGVAAVTLYPMPFDPMGRGGVDQFLPKLGILDRLLVGRPPSVLPPFVDPAGDPVADVIAVGVKLDPARLGKRLEPFDRSNKLHAIIGRQGLAAGDFAFLVAHSKERGPAPGTGVSAARTVGEDLDVR